MRDKVSPLPLASADRGDENRINDLIEFINQMPYSSHSETHFYEELLELSIRSQNLYGRAMAYINFSRLYQELQQYEQYTEYIKKAYEIAEQEQYGDILIRYYNMEGIRYMQNYDEANALSMYLKGLYLAIEISDYGLCAILYNNIAEIFYGNSDYDKAVLYYLKALDTLGPAIDSASSRYRKAFTENLINSYYLKKDLKNAKKYLQEYKSIACDDVIRPFVQEEVELKILMLEKKKEEALQNALAFLGKAKTSKVDDALLFYAYSFLCDIFLEFQRKEEAWFCLSKLEQMKMESSPNYVMEIQKKKIRYFQMFDVMNDSVFKEFYELSLQFELNNTEAVSNSLSAAVLLYETEKERRFMKKEQTDLEEFIMYDPLTGVYNRRIFDRIVNDCLMEETMREIAYIMIDIDYFKEYNDYYGHARGDEILKSVSSLLGETLPEQAYLARYGGDEFACLLVNKSVEEVNQFMQNVQEKMKEKRIMHLKAKTGNQLTVSLGAYYTYKNKNTNMDTLIKKADEALYQVKNNGRNGYLMIQESSSTEEKGQQENKRDAAGK